MLDQWSAYVIRLETERARHDAVKPASDRAAAMRATIPQWQDLAKHCKEAIKVLLERGADTFTERVQHYLPAKWKFDLKLVDPENPEREVFRVALIQNDGRPSGYMSGSQRDAVMIACAMAVAERGGTAAETPKKKGRKSKAVASVASAAAAAEPLYLLIPEDRDRDEETLKELLKAWAKFPGQVIVEVTKRPGRVPAGWQHINLNAWRASLSEATPAPTEKENEETVQPSPAAVPPPVPAPAAAAQTFAALPPGAPAPAPVQAPAPPAPPQEAAVSTEPQGPRAATEEDIADLRTLSWSDSDIWNADAAAIKYIRLNRVKPDRANIRPDGKVRVVVAPPALPPTA